MGYGAVTPVLFIMENGLEISSSSNGAGADDLTRIKEFVEEHVGDIYHIMTLSNISPIQQGYPTEKKRFSVVGTRNEQFVRDDLTNIFARVIANPVPVIHTNLTFLGLERISSEIADGIGALPSPLIASRIHGSGCMCSVVPYVLCAKHPCFCAQCKKGADLTNYVHLEGPSSATSCG